MKPNILFFHLDNASIGDFGCYGGAYPLGAKTPNIDQFTDECLLLNNYNVEAQCTPSRSAFVTGRHSVRTGCISALPGSGLVAWEETIADKLKALGYAGWKLELVLLQKMENPPVLEIVRRPNAATGFVVITRRWVVERTFAWLGRCRRLAKDWEKSISSSNAWLTIAAIRRQSRFIAKTINSMT